MPRSPLEPHLPSNNPRATKLQRLRQLSYLLDNAVAIPGTNYRVGLDPIIGLIPGAGDTVSGALSAYIIVEAARMGLPRAALTQMVSNVLLETVVGSVPVVGDFFDVTWKANAKNIVLLEDHLQLPPTQRRKTDWKFVALLIAILLLVVIGFAAISVLVIRFVIGLLTGG